jgi:hypothetical protein
MHFLRLFIINIYINSQIQIAENISIWTLSKKLANSPKDEMIMKELERQRKEQRLYFVEFGKNIVSFWNVQNYIKHFEAHVQNDPLIKASDIVLLAEVSARENTPFIQLPQGFRLASWSGATWRNSG